MKKRTSIIAFLLVAALTLGIGYAALTDTLTINGTANVAEQAGKDAFEADVYFSKAISGNGATAVLGSDPSTDKPDVATMTVVDGALKEVGDEAIATFTITSESDLPVTITNPTAANGYITNNNTEYFQVTTNWVADHEITPDATGKASVDITVTVKLIKTPETNETATFSILLNAST